MDLSDQALIDYAESSDANYRTVIQDARRMYNEIRYSPYRFEWAVRSGKIYTLDMLLHDAPDTRIDTLIQLAIETNNPATARWLEEYEMSGLDLNGASVTPQLNLNTLPQNLYSLINSNLNPSDQRAFRLVNNRISRSVPLPEPLPTLPSRVRIPQLRREMEYLETEFSEDEEEPEPPREYDPNRDPFEYDSYEDDEEFYY